MPGGNPASRFTRPRIRERNVRVVEDTFGVRASPQKVRKKFTNRYQIDLLDTVTTQDPWRVHIGYTSQP